MFGSVGSAGSVDSAENIWTNFNNVLRKDCPHPSGNNSRYNMASNISQESGYDTSKNEKRCKFNNENESSDADSEQSTKGTRVVSVDGKKAVFFRPSLQSEV